MYLLVSADCITPATLYFEQLTAMCRAVFIFPISNSCRKNCLILIQGLNYYALITVTTRQKLFNEYDSKIINEDGSQITFIDGGLYNYINQTGENTYKLFSYCYDYSVSPEKVWTNIYSLPGTVVSSRYLNKSGEILLNAFPNPASQSFKVAYTLPENVTQGILHLVDNSGRQVEQFIVDNHTDHLLLNVSNFQSGVYVYFIEYENGKSTARKLVVR